VNNPCVQFRQEYSLEDILAAPMIFEPLTKLQCCPTSDGRDVTFDAEGAASSYQKQNNAVVE
jgi:acetyl-CoA acetyltransferase